MCSSTIHIFIVSFPAQGQINPLLRLAKHLASNAGFLVTFSTTSSAGQRITTANDVKPGHLYPVGDGFLRFDFFGVVEPLHTTQFSDFPLYSSNLELAGRKWLTEMLRSLSDEGRPVSCLINGTIVPWVSDVAEKFGIPLAMMWPQSCASFLTCYYCYNELVPFPTEKDPYTDVEIPTLPLLKWDELHSFLHPSYQISTIKSFLLRDFLVLNKPFCILIDTFDALEDEILDLTTKICPSIKAVGPLFRGLEFDGVDPHKFDNTQCLDWLNSKPPRSVVYVCFGSIAHMKQEQVDEIAHGVLNAGAPFLWAMKAQALLEDVGPDGGMVVEYSPQERVLAHPSVACFVTHCGWNSMMEALTLGIPMVTFPLWGDQLMNAKFLVDVFGVAGRMGRGEHEEKVVPREEVERCIREAMSGPKAEEMRRNVMMWKAKAEKACQEGGSSDKNVRDLIEEIRKRSGDLTLSLVDGDAVGLDDFVSCDGDGGESDEEAAGGGEVFRKAE